MFDLLTNPTTLSTDDLDTHIYWLQQVYDAQISHGALMLANQTMSVLTWAEGERERR